MGEYQFYEFQALDRPLSKKEMQEIARLSSRGELTPYQAIFVYNYGDFPAEADEILVAIFCLAKSHYAGTTGRKGGGVQPPPGNGVWDPGKVVKIPALRFRTP